MNMQDWCNVCRHQATDDCTPEGQGTEGFFGPPACYGGDEEVGGATPTDDGDAPSD